MEDSPSFTARLLQRIVSLRRPVQLLSCAVVLIQCLLLAGCASSNFLVNMYLISFTLTATDTTSGFTRLEIRVGYFFLCARTEEGRNWICGDPDRIHGHLLSVTEPWNLYKTAYDFRDRAISPSLNIVLLATNLVSIFLVSSFPRLKIPDETVSGVSSWCRRIQDLSFAFNPICNIASSLLTAVWQHIAAATVVSLITHLSSGTITAVVGPAATAVAWVSFYLSLLTGGICLRANYAMYNWQVEVEDLNTGASRNTVPIWAAGVEAVSSLADSGANVEMLSLRAEGRDIA